jgi:hypothetical protein
MLNILKEDILNILKEENAKEVGLLDGRNINDFNLLKEDDTITLVDGISFNDFILNYANKKDLYLLENDYYYDFGFKSLNDKAIKE